MHPRFADTALATPRFGRKFNLNRAQADKRLAAAPSRIMPNRIAA